MTDERVEPTKEWLTRADLDEMIKALPTRRINGENEWFTYLDVNDFRDAILARYTEGAEHE